MLLTPSQNLLKLEVSSNTCCPSSPSNFNIFFILQITDFDANDPVVGWGGQSVVGPVPGAPGALAPRITSADPPTTVSVPPNPPQLSLANYYASRPPPQHPTDLPTALTILRLESLRNPGEVEKHRQLLVEVSKFSPRAWVAWVPCFQPILVLFLIHALL